MFRYSLVALAACAALCSIVVHAADTTDVSAKHAARDALPASAASVSGSASPPARLLTLPPLALVFAPLLPCRFLILIRPCSQTPTSIHSSRGSSHSWNSMSEQRQRECAATRLLHSLAKQTTAMPLFDAPRCTRSLTQQQRHSTAAVAVGWPPNGGARCARICTPSLAHPFCAPLFRSVILRAGAMVWTLVSQAPDTVLSRSAAAQLANQRAGRRDAHCLLALLPPRSVPPSKSLAPEYAKAATELKALGVPLGKLDATVHSKTAGAHSISGYPTLKVFRNGRATDYNGPRKADGIVAFMKKQTGPASKPISTDAELQKLLQQEPSVQYVILGLFNEGKVSQLQSSWAMLTNRLRDEFLFARSSDAALKAKYNVAPDAEAIIAFLYQDRTTYEGSSKTSDVEAFIRQNSLPLVGEYSEQTAPHYASRKLPVAKLFLNVDRKPRSQTMKYYTNRLRKLADQFKGKVLVAFSDRTGSKAQLDHLNMAEEEHGFIVEDPSANKLWRFEPDEAEEAAAKKTKGLNIEAWGQFIEDVLAGEVPVYTRSQRAPKNNMALPVKIATGANFDELVNDDEKDVLIEFYGA